MKICILTHTFPRHNKDFAAPFMHGVANGIESAGNDVYVLTPFTKGIKNKRKNQKYKLITYKYIFPDFSHKLGYSQTLKNDMGLKLEMLLLSPFMYFFGTIALIKLIRKEKIDLVNAHWILPNGLMASVASLLTGVPVVSTLPGSDVYMAERNAFFSFLARFSARTSKAITSNSPQLLKDLARISEKNKKKRKSIQKKFSPIIYGVDPNKFKPTTINRKKIRKEFQVNDNDTMVLGVGRLVAKKGFKYLIEATPRVIKENPRTIFVLAGEGDQREELELLAKKLNVYDLFRFPGWVNYDDMVHYMNACEVFILPSVRDEEGNLDDQSVSVVETMSCGKPVISTNFPGYKIVIKDGENGYLVDEKAPEQIANALNKLVGSKKLQEKMGKKSRELILKHFTWPKIGKEYTKLFSTLVKKYYSDGVPIILERKGRIGKAKQILSVLENHLGETKNLNLLDVGCSSGVASSYLSSFFKSVAAVDVDEKAIYIAKKSNKKRNLKFLSMNSEKMGFKNGSFDVVVCHQVYNFVDNPQKLVSEIKRVLKPGGVCYFAARNKHALIEAQYKLPLLSWFPINFAKAYLGIFKKGEKYFGENYMSYYELKNLVKGFKMNDYTINIIKNPKKFRFVNLEKYSVLLNVLPLKLFLPFIPNYVWILEKEK